MELSELHKEVLRHTLGLKKDGDDTWRNYFVAGEGHTNMPTLNELLLNDYMAVRDNPGGSGYLFRATDKGREAVGAGARKTPNDAEASCLTPDKCRIHATGPSMSTLMDYSPVYDGHGNNLNPDQNKHYHPRKCFTCGREWSA